MNRIAAFLAAALLVAFSLPQPVAKAWILPSCCSRRQIPGRHTMATTRAGVSVR